MIISRWDDRLGVVLEGAYPPEVANLLGDDDLLTIFSTHAISEEAGIMSMRIKRNNIVSYYSGLPEDENTDQFFVALILDPEEDPTQYEEGLAEIANMLIPTVGKPGFQEFFAESFEKIQKFVGINEEQRYSFIYRDNNRRLLLERLTHGPMTKEGLAKWISKEIGEEITDIEGLLNPMRKTHLIEEINISKGKKVTLEYVFLVRDVAVIRTPNVELYNAARQGQMEGELRDKFIDETVNFFKNYRITGKDMVELATVISDPDYYEIIKALREGYIAKAELPMKLEREVKNLEEILRDLAEKKIITAIKDKKERVWLFLLSDIKFITFFPEYMVDVIRRRWKEGTIQKEIALKHLELLRAEYIATQAPKYRKNMLKQILVIFESAQKDAIRGNYDVCATKLDRIANTCRDMGERETAEIVDKAAKAMREDKQVYVEEGWEEDRLKIIEYLEDIQRRDEELLKKKGKEKSKKPPKKKPQQKKKKQKSKTEKKKSDKEEKSEEQQAEEESIDLEEEISE